jgi:hypothetical protein
MQMKSLAVLVSAALLALIPIQSIAQAQLPACVQHLIDATESNEIQAVSASLATFEQQGCKAMLQKMGLEAMSPARIAFALYVQTQKRVQDANRKTSVLTSASSSQIIVKPNIGPGAVGHIRIDSAAKLPNIRDK